MGEKYVKEFFILQRNRAALLVALFRYSVRDSVLKSINSISRYAYRSHCRMLTRKMRSVLISWSLRSSSSYSG